jgi:monofunctional biosynthetic peptidoglycan transglycosylase
MRFLPLPSKIFRRLRRIMLQCLIFGGLVHLWLFLSVMLAGLYYRSENPRASALMAYRTLLDDQLPNPVRFLPLDELPKATVPLLVDMEDHAFFEHNGINPKAILWAWRMNRKAGYYKYGGSTITQQLARNLFLIPDKLLVRKYFEILVALEMELFLPKERILELYLNYIEWGRGIFGIETASLHYFQKSARDLSDDELVRLITVIPSPIIHSPTRPGWSGDLFAARYDYMKVRMFAFRNLNIQDMSGLLRHFAYKG